MNCMKCGKETKNSNVFCPQCLAVMEKYPVKPDARFHLPSRPVQQAVKKHRRVRRMRTAEEELTSLRKKVRWLVAWIIVLTFLLGATGAALAYTLLDREDLNIGRNYTYEETTE